MSLTRTTPLHRFRGHRDEVNVVKFSPCGTLVASCSDDSTVRVWSLRNIAAVDRDISAKPVKKGDEARRIDVDEDDGGPGGVFVLEGHESDVHQIAWHPEAGKPASTGPRLLASCVRFLPRSDSGAFVLMLHDPSQVLLRLDGETVGRRRRHVPVHLFPRERLCLLDPVRARFGPARRDGEQRRTAGHLSR